MEQDHKECLARSTRVAENSRGFLTRFLSTNHANDLRDSCK